MARPFTSPQIRYWPKVAVAGPDECWVWTGASRKSEIRNYGNFWTGRRYIEAHRFAYEMVKGPIPEGLVLDHLCRNHLCVNPAHLEAVTHRENCIRGGGFAGRNVSKTHCPQNHPYDSENTYVDQSGGRSCRTCRREYTRRWRAANRKRVSA